MLRSGPGKEVTDQTLVQGQSKESTSGLRHRGRR